MVLAPIATTSAIATTEKPRPSVSSVQTCSKLGLVTGNLNSDINKRLEKINQERKDSDTKLTGQRQEADTKLAQTRKEADSRKAEHYAKLEALATTDEQKQAVKTFEDTVSGALAIRRAAHDTNRTAFRAGVDAAIQARRSAIDLAVNTLKSDYQVAVVKAQATCAAGTAYKQAADQLKIDLTTARDKFKASKAVVSSIGDQVKALEATRKDANKVADDAFKATFDTALKQLLSAFGNQQV